MLPQGQDFFSAGELLLAAVVVANLLGLVAAIGALLRRRDAFAAEWYPEDRPDAARHSGRMLRAIAILRRLAIVDAVYFILVLATTTGATAPTPTPRLGDAVCHAHRCIAVVNVQRAPSMGASRDTTTIALTLRLTNSSRYTSHDPWPRRVFVVDDRGGRYPLASTESPLAVPLDAGELRTTIRRFTLPAAARPVGFLVDQTDGPGYAPALRCLVVGGSCWHAAPTRPAILLE